VIENVDDHCRGAAPFNGSAAPALVPQPPCHLNHSIAVLFYRRVAVE
jgi:hypothetical protein